METPVLLIDGNNLAHFLYTNLLPGHKMTAEDSQRLIGHLSSYARSNAGEVEVELCFDRSPGPLPDLPAGLRVFYAEHPKNGDALLLERYAYQCFDRRPCLVITNDEEVLEEVRQAGGAAIKAADFVRRAGAAKPVFRTPDDLPPISAPAELPQEAAQPGSIPGHPRPIPAASSNRKRTNRQPAPPNGGSPVRSAKNGRFAPGGPAQTRAISNNPLPGNPRKTGPAHSAGPAGNSLGADPGIGAPRLVDPPASSQVDLEQAAPGSEHTQPGNPAPPYTGPTYHLTIESWPERDGARFLQDAFCPTHRAELHELIEAVDPETARTADLIELANLLVEHCGAEVNFGRQGALMVRVRLALLRAPGQALTIEQLAEETGYKLTGLHGRIKEKAGKWIRIDYGNLLA